MFSLIVIKQGQEGHRVYSAVRRRAASYDTISHLLHCANIVRLTSPHARPLAHMQWACSNIAAVRGSQRGHIAGCIACHARPVIAVAAVGRPSLQAARLQLPQVPKPLPQRRHRSRCAQATSQAQPKVEQYQGAFIRARSGTRSSIHDSQLCTGAYRLLAR